MRDAPDDRSPKEGQSGMGKGDAPVVPSSASIESAEQLALLLDRRLSDDERAKVLASIDADPEAREALADAAAVLEELNDSSHVLEGRRSSVRSTWMHFRVRRDIWLAAAAVLVIALAVPLVNGVRKPARLPPVETIALALEHSGSASITTSRPWREFRGAAQPVSRQGRAVRLGALLADLSLFAAAGDTAATSLAAQIAAAVDEYPGGSAVGDSYRAMIRPGALPDALTRGRGAQAAEALVGERTLRLGGWLEAARIAAVRHDSAFFERPTTATAIRIATEVASSDSGATLDVALLSTTVTSPRRDWDQLSRAVNAALAALAN